MRKDVKIGLAIAGVLFAVLVVYLIVPSQKNTKVADSSETPSALPTDVAPGDTAGTEVATAGGSTTPVTGGSIADPFAATLPKPAPSEAVADAGKPENGTDWLKTFETGNVVVESHPSLVALTRTPTPGDAAKPTDASGSLTPAIHEAATSTGSTPTIPAVAGSTTPAVTGGTGVGTTGATGSSPITPSLATPAIPTSVSARTHTVKSGETLSSIAQSVYGKASFYVQIQKANPNVNPNAIRPGTVLQLPAMSAAAMTAATTPTPTARTPEAAKPVNASTEYRVEAGDSLHKISMKLYNDAKHVDDLYELNKKEIGSDPARVKVGMVLKLPESPKVASTR